MGASLGSARRTRWSAFVGSERPKLNDISGKVGLRNIGNTCFMNAGLQCLCHIEPLVVYFLSGKYQGEVQKSSSSSSSSSRREKPCVAEAFAQLVRALWTGTEQSFNPQVVHRVFRRQWPFLFEEYAQQDVQEFLTFLMAKMNEELNLVLKPPPATEMEAQAKQDEKAVEGQGEEFAAALAWLRYLQRGRSFLVDLFQGQERSTTRCERCGYTSNKFEPFMYLSVPVNKRMTSVADAIKKYLEDQALNGDDQWMCKKCKCKVDARKSTTIWKAPPVLILLLKRFEFDMATCQTRKVQAFLRCPGELDLSDFVSSRQREAAIYDVVSVANHHGGYGSGHYTAFCRVGKPCFLEAGESQICEHSDDGTGGNWLSAVGEWYEFDDSHVSRRTCRADCVVTKDAYVIFLLRRGQEGVKLRRQSASRPEVWPHLVSARNSALFDFLPTHDVHGHDRASRPAKAARASSSVARIKTGSPVSSAAVTSPKQEQQQQLPVTSEQLHQVLEPAAYRRPHARPQKRDIPQPESRPRTSTSRRRQISSSAVEQDSPPCQDSPPSAAGALRIALERKVRDDDDWDCTVSTGKKSPKTARDKIVDEPIFARSGKSPTPKAACALEASKGLSVLVSV